MNDQPIWECGKTVAWLEKLIWSITKGAIHPVFILTQDRYSFDNINPMEALGDRFGRVDLPGIEGNLLRLVGVQKPIGWDQGESREKMRDSGT